MQNLHNHGYIHGDLKPDNFMFGFSNETCKKLFLIDFGGSKRYIESKIHIPNAENVKFTGNFRYASLNSMIGYRIFIIIFSF